MKVIAVIVVVVVVVIVVVVVSFLHYGHLITNRKCCKFKTIVVCKLYALHFDIQLFAKHTLVTKFYFSVLIPTNRE